MATTQQGQRGAETGVLESALAQVTRRLRMARRIRHTSRGALIGTGVSFIAVILAHFSLLPSRLPLEALIPVVIVLGVGIGSLTASLRPISAMEAARLAETRLGLKERLSSALEFERAAPPHDPEAALLLRMQKKDAASHAQRLEASKAVPLPIPWEARSLVPALLLLLLALILPNLPVFIPPALRTERATVAKAGEKLFASAQRIEKQAEARHLDQTRRAAQKMEQLGRQMAQGKMDKRQAFVAGSKLSHELQEEQRRTAEANGGQDAGGKNLAQAGKQLAQSLQGQPASSRNSTGTKPASGSASQRKSTNGKSAKGFNIPPGQKPNGKAGENGQKTAGQQKGQPTPEVQEAAQAMQQNDVRSLSEQLRRLARRADTGKMSPSEQHQAAQDLQKLSNALQGTPLSETQKHVQAAADAMKQGDQKHAADEMRKAADAAEREARQAQQQQSDRQGMQDAQSSLQQSEGEMAQASKPGDIKNGSGQQGKSGQGNQPGQGKGPAQGNGKFNDAGKGGGNGQSGGAPANGTNGAGRGAPTRPGPGDPTRISGVGYKTPSQNMGVWRGAAHPLDPKFDPTKNPKYGKIYLGKPQGNSQGGLKTGPIVKSSPTTPPNGSTASSVPYYNYAPAYKKSAESAMDQEDIPPAYRENVRKYYGGLPSGPDGSRGAH